MEQIHGVDVSWMTHGSKEKGTNRMPRRRNTLQSPPVSPSSLPESPPTVPRSSSPLSASLDNPSPLSSSPPISGNGSSTRLQRRPSWFSNISSKFISSTGPSSPTPQTTSVSPKQAELSVPRAHPSKNAVLQHAAKYEGKGPYIPAPPKSSGQAGFFQVLRRLSTSSGSQSSLLKGNHGLVERRTLNVDQNRERCKLSGLQQAKLRRVAFCVDVEIAPMPKYTDQEKKPASDASLPKSVKSLDKSEGEALKLALLSSLETPCSSSHAENKSSVTGVPAPTENAAVVSTPSSLPAKAAAPASSNSTALTASTASTASAPSDSKTSGDGTRKKEKKKKSEEERKARKERKRRLAEANGTIPMEIHLDSDDSEPGDPSKDTTTKRSRTGPHMQLTPTTNPVRIYRRCCQLRETPILKKIVEQLSDPTVFSSDVGVVTKLDLTGYWMQLADVVTLSDFLAVVPVRDVILDNCGLNDEGIRVILAGLLAARPPVGKQIHMHHHHHHDHDNGPNDRGHIVPVIGSAVNGTTRQGGLVERLVLKNNKISAEGWKYICLFVNMCRSLKILDVSKILLPQPPISFSTAQITRTQSQSSQDEKSTSSVSSEGFSRSVEIAQLLAKALGERLGGSTLELLNFGDTAITADSLGILIDGVIRCGTKRLGLAHNDLDDAGVQHVARYIASGKCESLDLGGNDLRDRLEHLVEAVGSTESLWALSLADCNLKPNSLCKLLPQLAKLHNFRFLDLSHNHALFSSQPSVTPLLRRYLPKMDSLKRLHLADVSMNAEQAIAIAEVIPEVKELAHLNILQNKLLAKLSDARTEETQEQACALYASLLAATRVSRSIVAVDIETPTAESTEMIRGMAKQVVAYCLRNVERVTSRNADAIDGDALAVPAKDATGASDDETAIDGKSISLDDDLDYPDVIQHLVGRNVASLEVDDTEMPPDDDYVIGGTGVAQALECCLKNRGTESGRPSGEFVREEDGMVATATTAKLSGDSKAKDMSKHLLMSARKIRLRLRASLQKAKALSGENNTAYQRLLFLDQTLGRIITRFEDEFPETRMSIDSAVSVSQQQSSEEAVKPHTPSLNSSNDAEQPDATAAMLSDGEDDTEIRPSSLSRSGSVISLSSKGLTNEEGRVLRAGHRFRVGWFKHFNLLSGVEEVDSDPAHKRILYELIHEINDPSLNAKVAEKGVVRVFNEDRQEILQILKAQDPEYWERFQESQEKARANRQIGLEDSSRPAVDLKLAVDEQAIEDDASV